MRKYAVMIFVVYLTCLTASAYSEGDITGFKRYVYWDNGHIKECDKFDTNGCLMAKVFCRYDGTVEKVERYDLKGNKIEEVLYDTRGRLRSGIGGWAAMRWWYNDSQLRSQITYDERGRPIERKHYSPGGKLVVRQFLDDAKADPYEEASMAMLLGGANMQYFDPRENFIDNEDLEDLGIKGR